MTYAWTVAADWVAVLDAEIELAELNIAEDSIGEVERRRERTGALVKFLAAAPEVRAAPAMKRKNIAYSVAERSDSKLDDEIISRAVLAVVPQIERAAVGEEVALMEIVDTLVEELSLSPTWRKARTIAQRLEATHAFLIVKSDGYRLNALGLAQKLMDATKLHDETPVKMYSARAGVISIS
jgi:hypothetical protein